MELVPRLQSVPSGAAGPGADATRVEAPAAGFRRTSRRLNGAFLTIRPRLLPVSSISIYVSIGTSDHVLRYWPLDGGDGVGPTLTELPNEERLYQKYLLAEAYNKLRRPREALALTGELLNLVNQTGKRSLEGDLYRLKGELLLLEDGKNETGLNNRIVMQSWWRVANAIERANCVRRQVWRGCSTSRAAVKKRA